VAGSIFSTLVKTIMNLMMTATLVIIMLSVTTASFANGFDQKRNNILVVTLFGRCFLLNQKH